MTIVEEIRKDRESGAKRLEAEYKAGLMTLARRFCTDPSDAEELVNATFAAVVDSIDNYLEQSAFFGWMCQILTNIYTMDSRRKSNQTVTCPGVVPDMADDSAQEAIYDNLDAALLRKAIDTLPKDQRDAIALHYFMDMSVAQIAKYLAVPTGTILSRLHYARKALAAKLGAEVKETANKPGVKATLIALALCATAALGSVWWGELSERAANEASGASPAALAATSDIRHPTAKPETRIPNPTQPSDDPTPRRFDDLTIRRFDDPTIRRFDDLTQEDLTMNKTTRSAALGAATALALAAAPPAASADGYQFIISGDPEYDPPESFLASGGTSLAGGPLSNRSASDALDARCRTAMASSGTSLRTDKYGGFSIILR